MFVCLGIAQTKSSVTLYTTVCTTKRRICQLPSEKFAFCPTPIRNILHQVLQTIEPLLWNLWSCSWVALCFLCPDVLLIRINVWSVTSAGRSRSAPTYSVDCACFKTWRKYVYSLQGKEKKQTIVLFLKKKWLYSCGGETSVERLQVVRTAVWHSVCLASRTWAGPGAQSQPANTRLHTCTYLT